MKIRPVSRIFSLFSSIGAVAIAMSLNLKLCADTPMYAEPNVSSEPIAIIDIDPESKGLGAPVEDSDLAAQGWRTMPYPGTFTGYVPRESISDDMGIDSGTPIYLRASYESPTLTSVESGDQLEMKWVGEWAEIRMTKSLPVYFLTNGSMVAEIVETVDSRTNTETGSTITYVYEQPGTSDTTYTASEVESLPYAQTYPVEGVASTAVVEPQPVSNIEEVPLAQTYPGDYGEAAIATEPYPVGTRTRGYVVDPITDHEGILRLTKRGMRNRTGFSFELVDTRGKRIALVDTREITLNPLEKYLDRPVVVHGTIQTVSYSRKYLVIRARLIRTK